jgi:hypothetical protein
MSELTQTYLNAVLLSQTCPSCSQVWTVLQSLARSTCVDTLASWKCTCGFYVAIDRHKIHKQESVYSLHCVNVYVGSKWPCINFPEPKFEKLSEFIKKLFEHYSSNKEKARSL